MAKTKTTKTATKKTAKAAKTPAKKTTPKTKKPISKTPKAAAKTSKTAAKSINAKSKKPRNVLIAVIIIIAIAFLVFMSPPFRYGQGMNAFRAGDYTSAQETFSSLGNYSESEAWAKDSATMIEVEKDVEAKEYKSAIEKLDGLTVAKDQMIMFKNIIKAENCLNDGKEAIEDLGEVVNKKHYEQAFFYLYLADKNQAEDSDYDEAKLNEYKEVAHASANPKITALADEAEKGLAYAEAEELYQSGKYDEAKTKFTELGDYMDAAQRAENCDATKAEKQSAYDEAEQLFNEKKFYQALKKFEEARPYLDATDRISDCYQETPESGTLKTSTGSGATLTAKAPKGVRNFYLKFYQDNRLVGTVFIRSGESADLSLPTGKTKVNMATGTQWFGETDLFGENGMYVTLSGSNSDKSFTFSSGTQYNLTLGGVTNGNVNATQVNQSDF